MCHADDISSSKFKEQPHLSSRPWPTQTRPPCRGDGLLHDRCRTSNPMPQLLLHWLQEDQGVQPPFLRGMKEEVWIALNVTWEFNNPRFYQPSVVLSEACYLDIEYGVLGCCCFFCFRCLLASKNYLVTIRKSQLPSKNILRQLITECD